MRRSNGFRAVHIANKIPKNSSFDLQVKQNPRKMETISMVVLNFNQQTFFPKRNLFSKFLKLLSRTSLYISIKIIPVNFHTCKIIPTCWAAVQMLRFFSTYRFGLLDEFRLQIHPSRKQKIGDFLYSPLTAAAVSLNKHHFSSSPLTLYRIIRKGYNVKTSSAEKRNIFQVKKDTSLSNGHLPSTSEEKRSMRLQNTTSLQSDCG